MIIVFEILFAIAFVSGATITAILLAKRYCDGNLRTTTWRRPRGF